MALIYNATHEEILRKLQKLTDASRLANHGDHPAMRDLGVSAYRITYDWLEAHGVPFVYDRAQGCYVEEVNDAD